MTSYRIERIERATDPAFEEAFGLLDAEFGSRGELERRAVIEGWLEDAGRGDEGGELELTYHLLVARDAAGNIAGVRDCHLTVDRAARRAVLYLAHVLVLPGHRRRGVGRLLREAPLALLCDRLPSGERLVAGEMEHPVASDPASLVRLVAYGRAGFRAIDPRALPYHQPDFRDPAQIATPAPVPLLVIVAWLDHEEARSLPRALAFAVLRHLYAVFATHCRAEHLAGPFAIARTALEAFVGDAVPLYPLPTSIDDEAALAPLCEGARGDRGP